MDSDIKYLHDHVRGYLNIKYPGIKVKDLRIQCFKDAPGGEKLDLIVRGIVEPVEEGEWVDNIPIEPDLLRIQFVLVGLRRPAMDYNDLRSLLNKSMDGSWPDAKYNNQQYEDFNYDECWHYRKIETATFGDGVHVELVGGFCFCS